MAASPSRPRLSAKASSSAAATSAAWRSGWQNRATKFSCSGRRIASSSVMLARSLASRFDRQPGSYEFQMLYGIRPEEQRRLARAGERMRVYIPYGQEWYGYLMRRLAERPQNLSFFVKSLISKK